MKVFISIDMEGICGIVGELETDPKKGGEAYQANRRLMTQEGNAAVEGCVKAGATDVVVADSHWNCDNWTYRSRRRPKTREWYSNDVPNV